jgi:hypothetical protein
MTFPPGKFFVGAAAKSKSPFYERNREKQHTLLITPTTEISRKRGRILQFFGLFAISDYRGFLLNYCHAKTY